MLPHLRSQLDLINEQLFQLLDSRAALVEKIQSEKKVSWDPERELSVFGEYTSNYPQNSLKEDLIYSLLIESQAQSFGYPRWSEGDHLKNETPKNIQSMLNPVLLRMRNESEYQALDLIDDYKKLLEGIWENQKLLQ